MTKRGSYYGGSSLVAVHPIGYGGGRLSDGCLDVWREQFFQGRRGTQVVRAKDLPKNVQIRKDAKAKKRRRKLAARKKARAAAAVRLSDINDGD